VNIIRMLDAEYSILFEILEEVERREGKNETIPLTPQEIAGLRYSLTVLSNIFARRYPPPDEIPF